MKDWLVEPYSTIGKGKDKMYKFKYGKDLYTEKEFKEILKNSVKVEDDSKPKAKQVNRKNKKAEPTTD